MFSRIKPYIERHTTLTSVYRSIRDAWTFQQQRPQVTPLGFKLIGRSDMQTGIFEPETTAIIQKQLMQADVFVDVGANIGYYTCLAKSLGKHAVAIEPLDDNLRYLYANLAENGFDDVEVWPVGVSDKIGFSTLYGGSTGASLVRGWAGASPFYKRAISLSTLDCLLGKRFEEKRLVIKIDIEGAEYLALQGAKSILTMSPRPIWIVEIGLTAHHPSGRNPHFGSTFSLFWQHAYRSRAIELGNQDVQAADVTEWVRIGTCPPGASNYIFESTSI